MKQLDCHGRKINYDAPGQLGAGSQPPQKLPRVDRFRQQLDRLVEYYNIRNQLQMPLRVTFSQMKQLCGVSWEHRDWKPAGTEKYRDHPLVLTEDP
jgi:hypothetical protein